MKIALLTEYREIGGGESNLLNLAEELGHRADVTLFCSGKVKKQAIQRGIDVAEFVTGKKWIRWLPLISIDKELMARLNRFDIVHAYSLNVLPSLFFIKSKKVWTVHGYWEKPYGIRSFMIDKIVDKIVCVSTDVCNRAKFDPEKKTKIFLGTNFKPGNKTVRHFDRNDIHISCIGRFQQIKGQDLLVDALEGISGKIDAKISLRFVGDVNSGNAEDLEFKQHVLDRVRNIRAKNIQIYFEGFAQDVKSYIEDSDLVVIPSRYESFSMVAIEALACGKPIIAPDAGGPKDIIDCEEIGLLFEAGNSQDLGRCIKAAIDRYASFNVQKCMKRAEDFTVMKQAQRHMKLYEELLND